MRERSESMKAKTILLVLLLMGALCNAQQQVTRQEAINAAVNTMKYYGKTNISNHTVSDVLTLGLGGPTLIYEVHFVSGESVLLSGSRLCKPVLGYSKEEPNQTLLNHIEDLPDGLKFLIDCYMEQIDYSFENPTNEMYEKDWDFLLQYNENRAMHSIIVNPLLTSRWGQSKSNDENHRDKHAYNYYVTETHCDCEDDYCPAGCVAVALAQILRKWESTPNNPGRCYTLDYQWENMPDSLDAPWNYNWNSSYITKRDAIATLIKDCGIQVGMDYCGLQNLYSPDPPHCGSAATDASVLEALDYFGYYHNDNVSYKSAYSQENWEQKLQNDLDRGYPIYYAGNNSIGKGHAFVCDGYDDNHLFHFNWGWNSSGGWYSTTAGNLSLSYKYAQRAIFDIHPIEDCWEDIIFECNKNIFTDHDYYASNLISNNDYDFIVNAQADVSMKAKEIRLTQGFHATYGSKFHAIINPCSPNNADGIIEQFGNKTKCKININNEKIDNNNIQPDEDFVLFPNPAMTRLYIQSNNILKGHLFIRNMYGEILFEKMYTENTVIDISNLSSGTYIVQWLTETGKYVTKKLIKL